MRLLAFVGLVLVVACYSRGVTQPEKRVTQCLDTVSLFVARGETTATTRNVCDSL